MSFRGIRQLFQSFFSGTFRRTAKSRSLRLLVETLENRETPTAYTWTPTTAGTFDWNNPSNWSPNTGFPNAAGDVANLTSALAGNETVNLNVPIIVGTLNIGASTGTNTFTVAAGTAGSLELSDPSLTSTVSKTSGGADQINASLTLDNALNVTNSAASQLAFGGNISLGSSSLSLAGTGNMTFSGIMNATVSSPGTTSLTDNGPGNATFTTNNALNIGNINVNAGTFAFANLTLSVNEVLNISGGAFADSSGTLQLTADGNANPNPLVTGGGTLDLTSTTNGPTSPDIFFDFNDADNSTANWGTNIDTAIDLGSVQRYIFGKTNHNGFGVYGLNADCVISGPISGSGGITFIAQDTFSNMEVPLVLNADNTFTGPLNIVRGSVYLDSPNALAQNNVLTFDPAAGDNARLFLWGNNAEVSDLSSSGAGTVLIANGNRGSTDTGTTLPPATLTVTENNPETFGGNFLDYFQEYSSGGAGNTTGGLNLVKTGPATLTLTGDNSIPIASAPDISGPSGSFTISAGTLDFTSQQSLPALGSIILDGGTLQYTGATGATANLTTVNSTGGTIDSSGAGSLSINTPLTFPGPTATTLTLTGTNTGGNSISTALSDASGSTTSIVKMGSGTWDLAGANTYTGSTQVNAGVLQVDGSLTSPVTVAAGATLGGSGGSIAAAVTVNGTLTGGDANSPTGSLSVGSLSFGGTAALKVAVNSATAGTGFDQFTSAGAVKLNGAALNLSVQPGFIPAIGTVFDILVNNSGSAISGTFAGLAEGSTVSASGVGFKISYVGGTSGHDVTLTAQPAHIDYADTAWAGLANGTAITDADPVASGNQPATIGTNAFASVNAAIAAIAAGGTVVVNGQYSSGGTGNFAEDVVVNKQIILVVQAGPVSFNSLADSASSSIISLSVDATKAPITLTVGGDNANTTIAAPIAGVGNLTKIGTGTLILSGNDNYTGMTTVSAGTLQAGSATAFGSNASMTVAAAGTLTLNGYSNTFGSLSGAGLVQNASATPATLTVGSANSSTTFSGVLADGAGGGSLSLVSETTGTFTLSGANSSYTGSTTVNAGTLSVSTLANGGANSSIGASSNASSNLVLQGGSTFLYSGAASGSSDRGFTLGTGGATISNSSAATTMTLGASASTIVNGGNALTTSGAGGLSFGGVFTGSAAAGVNPGTLTANGPGNVSFTNPLAFGSANNETTYGTITTGNVDVTGGDLTLVNIHLDEVGSRFPSIQRELAIGAGAFVTATGTVAVDPSENVYTDQIIGPGTLQLRNPSASLTDPSITQDFGPNGGDGGPWGAFVTATIDVGSGPTQWIVGKANRNDVSRYAGDFRFDAPIVGSAGIQIAGLNANNTHNFHMVFNADNSGFTGAVYINNCDLDLTNNNALSAANSVTFDGTLITNPAANATNTQVLYLWGFSVTIGSLNDTSNPATTSYIRNGAESGAPFGHTNGGNATSGNGGIALGQDAPSVLTIDQTVNGIFNGQLGDGPNDDGSPGDGGAMPFGLYDTLSIVKTGAASLAINGAMNNSGTTTISQGVLSVQSISGTSAYVLNGGTLQYTGPTLDTDNPPVPPPPATPTPIPYQIQVAADVGTIDTSGTGPLRLGTAGAVNFTGATPTTLTLTGTNTGQNTLAVPLADGSGGATSVTKTGTGTWDLAGTNTYTGPTTVSGGELLVDGSLTSPVTVAGGATLGGAAGATAGSGTIAAGVIVNGTLTAGDVATTGLLNVGNLSFGTGAAYSAVLAGTTAGTSYDQVTGTGTINLNNATLNVSVANGFSPTAGTVFDILVDGGPNPITGTFKGLPEGATIGAGANLFTISYQGGTSGHDVTLTNVPLPTYYVDSAWAGLAKGAAIADADPVAPGNQPATFGTNAFASVNAAIAAILPYGTVVVNGQYTGGGSGNYAEDVLINKQLTLIAQAGPVSFGSFADSVPTSVITLGVDTTGNPITLTVGGDNASTTISGNIGGGGGLTKAGTGTLTLGGADSYTGATAVSAGTLKAGSAAAFGNNPSVTVAAPGTLVLNGFNYSFASLSGAGTVENANATPASLTVGSANTSTTFSGTLADGPGGGALSLDDINTGTFTLSGSNSYTGSTTVAGGTLSISTLANGGANSSIGASSNAPANLVIQGGGTLLYTGGTVSTDRGFTIGTGGATITANTASSTLTLGGNVLGTGSLTLSGVANMVFNGTSIGGGAFTDNGPGNVTISAPNALNSGSVAVNAGVFSINTVTLSINREINIAGGAAVNSSGTINLTADGNVNPNYLVAGAGTLNLTSTTNGPTSPDIYFNFNDADNSTANWGTAISANINLGSTQRYFYGKTNHNSFAKYGLSADAVITGAISGSGGISFIAQDNFVSTTAPMEAPLVLAGADTFTGELEIQRGSVYLDNAAALTQGNVLVLDPAAGNNARLFLNGFNATVSNLSSSSTGNAAIANGNVPNPSTSVPAAILTITQNTPGTFSGVIADNVLEYSATGTGTTTGGLSIVKNGSAPLSLGGANTYSGTTTVAAGELLIDGSVTSPVTVATGATLGGAATAITGSGTVGSQVIVNGTLTAGDVGTTGQLTVNTLSFGASGAFDAALGGTTPGSGYDQITGTGSINVTGATLNLSLVNGFIPAVGNNFDILADKGGSPITGNFVGLPEGAKVSVGGIGFTITYLGGASGHDVVLTVKSGIDHFVLYPTAATTTAGAPFAVLVIAEDANGNVVNVNGTITLTSTDPLVRSEGSVAMHGGYGAAPVVLDTASTTETITVAGGGANTTTSPFAVTPAATSKIVISGAPASIITGTPVTVTVTAVDVFGNTTPAYTGTVHFTSTDPRISAGSGLPANYTFTSGTGLDNGAHTFTNGVTLLTSGSQTITATDTATATIAGSTSAIGAIGLQVTSVVGNPTGFTVNFNKPFDPNTLKLYGTTPNDPGLLFASTNSQIEANAGQPQQLTGSVVPNATDTAFTFVESTFADQNGGLPNGVYDLSLLSSVNGLKDMGGAPLDASNSSNTAANLYSTVMGHTATAYSASFTLSAITALTDTTQAAPSQVAVSLPAFAQGPGLPVHVQVHNSGGAGGTYPGIPATISDGNNATTVSFSVTYNTATLTVTGGVVDPSILAGYPHATFTRTTTGMPVGGMETDTFSFSTGDGSQLNKGSAWTLGDITATVPNTSGQQIYRSKQLLTISNIASDGGTHGGISNANLVGGDGFEVVAYLGDTSGDGNIQLNDATLANNVGNPFIGGGFSAYPKVDPVVIADTDGAGFVDSSSVGNIASLAIGHAQATIPTPPQGRITSSGGADPDLSLPGQVNAVNGLVEVPVNLDNAMPVGSTGLTEATLDLIYDPRVLSVSASDVHLGSLPSLGTGWTVSSVVNQAAGQLVIQLYSSTPLTVSAAGSLVTVGFHTLPGAQGTDSVSLVNWANPTGQVWFRTSLSDTNGSLTLGNSTGQASVSGEGRGARGDSSMAAPVTTGISSTGDADSKPGAQAMDSENSLAGALGSEIDVITERTGPSGVPSDPATAAVFQFGNVPSINVLQLVSPGLSPGQLLIARLFGDLARQSSAWDEKGSLEYLMPSSDQAVCGDPSVLDGPALEEYFAQLAAETE